MKGLSLNMITICFPKQLILTILQNSFDYQTFPVSGVKSTPKTIRSTKEKTVRTDS